MAKIDKTELISCLEENMLWTKRGWEDITSVIDELPTIDIVYCSECEWWERIGETKYGICYACKHQYLSNRWDISIRRKTEEEHYCADGERRTEYKPRLDAGYDGGEKNKHCKESGQTIDWSDEDE